jgi:hypothetical protein
MRVTFRARITRLYSRGIFERAHLLSLIEQEFLYWVYPNGTEFCGTANALDNIGKLDDS